MIDDETSDSAPVRAAYDECAELYAELFLDEITKDAPSLRALDVFVEAATGRAGTVLDLGCGPGSAVDLLRRRGLDVVGRDVSPGQLAQARSAFPDCRFEPGDLRHLDVDDQSLAGIVARYSIIHLDPGELTPTFTHWHRALSVGAPLFLAFFGSRSPEHHGRPFDHRVITAHELCPTIVAQLLERTGFAEIAVETTPLPPDGRPFDRATILARRTTS